MLAGGRATCLATPGQGITTSRWPAGVERRLPSVVLETHGHGPECAQRAPKTLRRAERISRPCSGPAQDSGATECHPASLLCHLGLLAHSGCPRPGLPASTPQSSRPTQDRVTLGSQLGKGPALLGCTESTSCLGSRRLDRTCQALLIPSCFASLDPGQALCVSVALWPLAHVWSLKSSR